MPADSAAYSGARGSEVERRGGEVPGRARRRGLESSDLVGHGADSTLACRMAGTDLIADLEARGLIHDSTDREFLRTRLASGPVGDLLRVRSRPPTVSTSAT